MRKFNTMRSSHKEILWILEISNGDGGLEDNLVRYHNELRLAIACCIGEVEQSQIDAFKLSWMKKEEEEREGEEERIMNV